MNGKEFIKAVKNITAEKGISEDLIFTTIEDAKASYGVVIDPNTMTVDEEATAKLRA